MLSIIYILRYRRPASFIYSGNTFLPTKRPHDQFTIDTADPRLQMGPTEPIYQETSTTPAGTAISSTGDNSDPLSPTSPTATSAHVLHGSRSLSTTRSPSSESFKSTQDQQQHHHLQKERPISAALFGSMSLTTGLSARPMSSMSHCVTESNLSSFSGTTTTKPDQQSDHHHPLPPPPSSPTSPVGPTMQRIKPDGES